MDAPYQMLEKFVECMIFVRQNENGSGTFIFQLWLDQFDADKSFASSWNRDNAKNYGREKLTNLKLDPLTPDLPKYQTISC